MTDQFYWFSDEDSEKVVDRLSEADDMNTTWSSNPVLQAWVRNSVAYYSAVLEPSAWDTSLVFQGEQGELIKMIVPEARLVARQIVSVMAKQRLSFQCLAGNRGGTDVMNTCRLGNAVCDQLVDTQDVDSKYDFMLEQGYVVGVGYMFATWRTDKGIPWMKGVNDELIYDGDVEIWTPTCWDVTYEYQIPNWADIPYARVRRIMNRYDLIAQFPDMEQEILALEPIKSWQGPFSTRYQSPSADDFVYCFEVYHRPTPALPAGRMIFYSDSKTIYYDGENAYGCIPGEQYKPEKIANSGLGYPKFSDILPAQEMLDTLFSSVATNNAAFAVQNVTVPRGQGVSVQEILGMNFISYTPTDAPGGGKPEALQLTKSAPETFKLIEMLESRIEKLAMLNAALRGDPPPGVTAGTAIATLTTNALEFIMAASKEGRKTLQKVMFHAINAYRRFASTPKLVSIAGKNFQIEDKEFVGSDLDPIKSVRLTETNPIMQTIAGRSDLAEKLMQNGLVKTTQDYISILDGAPVRQVYETEASENDLVQSENEALMDGEPVIALWTDDHPVHIRKHAGLLNQPKVRLNSQMVQAVLAHIEEHQKLQLQTDPALLAMVRTGTIPQGPQPTDQGPPPPPPSGGGEPGMIPNSGDAEAQGLMPSMESSPPAEDLLGRG